MPKPLSDNTHKETVPSSNFSIRLTHTHTQAGRQTQTYTAEPSSFSYSLQQQHLVGVGKSNTKLWVTG